MKIIMTKKYGYIMKTSKILKYTENTQIYLSYSHIVPFVSQQHFFHSF